MLMYTVFQNSVMVTGTLVADRQKKSKYSSEITEFQEKQRINVAFCALLTFSL